MRQSSSGKITTLLLCFSPVNWAFAVEHEWQYTTTAPCEGWQQPDAPASSDWKTGRGGFGTPGTPGGRNHTLWNTPDIWLRGEYVLERDKDVEKLKLEVCHDEDFEVYINGVIAAEDKGYFGDYKLYIISPEARKALKVGKNVIAVHCHQTAGGQYIDVGFTDKQEPFKALRTRPPEIVDVRRPAAETGYEKEASWTETMLAVRAGLLAKETEIDLAMGSAVAYELWRDFPHQIDWLMQDSAGQMIDWVAGYRDGKGDVTNFLKGDRDATLVPARWVVVAGELRSDRLPSPRQRALQQQGLHAIPPLLHDVRRSPRGSLGRHADLVHAAYTRHPSPRAAPAAVVGRPPQVDGDLLHAGRLPRAGSGGH